MNDSKKKGFIFFILLFSLIICLIVCLVIFIFLNKDKDELIDVVKKPYGVISRNKIDYKNVNIEGMSDFLIVYDDNKCGIIDIDSNLVVDIKYDYCFVDKDSFLVSDKISYIYRNNGEMFLESEYGIEDITDLLSNYNYYLVSLGNENNYIKYNLYNTNLELLYEFKSDASNVIVVGNYIVLDNEIIDFESGDKFKIEDSFIFGEYYIIELTDGSYILYNSKNRESRTFSKGVEKEDCYIFFNGDDKLVVDFYGEIENDVKILNDKYKLDYSMCDAGAKILDKDNNELYDGCYELISEELLEKNDYFYVLDVQSNKYLLLYEDKKIELDDDAYTVGEFIVTSDSNFENKIIYNLNGEKFENICRDNFLELSDGNYFCSDYGEYFIVDSNLERISDYYDDMVCNFNVCIFKGANELYGLIINGEVIIEPSYYSAILADDKVLFETLTGTELIRFGYSDNLLGKDDLKYEIEIDYKDIIVDEVISEYQLDNIRDLIYDNEELFKKYASLVLNNDKLGDYKKYLLEMFNVAASNIDVLNEYRLYYGLYNLSFENTDYQDDGIAGKYYDYEIKIDIRQDTPNVVRHEIMHFFDYRMKNSIPNEFYICNDKYYLKKDLKNLNDSELGTCVSRFQGYDFLVEAGAEYNLPIYTDSGSSTYSNGTIIFYLLSYYFGEDFINDVYFSEDRYQLLYEKLSTYITVDEIDNLIENSSNITLVGRNHNDKDYVKVFKIMKKLCKAVLGKEWYEDNKTRIALSFFIGYIDVNGLVSDNDIKYLIDNCSFIDDVLKKISSSYSYYSSGISITLVNDKNYLGISIYEGEEIKLLQVEYDFNTNTIISSEIVS